MSVNEPPDSSLSRFFWILVGLAAGIAGNIAYAEYSDWKSENQSREERATELLNSYEAIGAEGLREARIFVTSGNVDGIDEYRLVSRHFRRLISDVSNDEVDIDIISRRYGGILKFWSKNFLLIGEESSPASARLDAEEIITAKYLSLALAEITTFKNKNNDDEEIDFPFKNSELEEIHHGPINQAMESSVEAANDTDSTSAF